jgi:hypothetical protein
MSFNWDPMGKLLIELRDDPGVAAIVGANPSTTARVRIGEPAPGDGQGPGSYRAFVVLVNEGGIRFKRLPVQRPRVIARCYGRSFQEAAALAVAVSNAQHYRRSRVHNNGLGIYASWDDAGGEQDRDPNTQQPFVTVFLDLLATTQAVS